MDSKRLSPETRARLLDALVDFACGAILIAAGLFVGAYSIFAAAEGGGEDTGTNVALLVAILMLFAALIFFIRAIRGRGKREFRPPL